MRGQLGCVEKTLLSTALSLTGCWMVLGGAVRHSLVFSLGVALGACLAFWSCQYLLVDERRRCSDWVSAVGTSSDQLCEERVSNALRAARPFDYLLEHF